MAGVPEDQEFKRRRISSAGKLARDDSYGRSNGDGIKDFDNVSRSHSHTSKTAGCSDHPLLRGAVNVDAACSSVLVARFDAFQPEDAGDNGIATTSVPWDDFAAKVSSLEDGSHGKVVAQLHTDTEPPERRLVAVGSVSETKFGS